MHNNIYYNFKNEKRKNNVGISILFGSPTIYCNGFYDNFNIS